MALSTKYLRELKEQGLKSRNIIVEINANLTQFLADGTHIADGSITAVGSTGAAIKIGQAHGGFSDVHAALKTVTSNQNTLDLKKGYSSRGNISFTIDSEEIVPGLIANNFLRNVDVIFKEGFIADDFEYSDYNIYFKGRIIDCQGITVS